MDTKQLHMYVNSDEPTACVAEWTCLQKPAHAPQKMRVGLPMWITISKCVCMSSVGWGRMVGGFPQSPCSSLPSAPDVAVTMLKVYGQ